MEFMTQTWVKQPVPMIQGKRRIRDAVRRRFAAVASRISFCKESKLSLCFYYFYQ